MSVSPSEPNPRLSAGLSYLDASWSALWLCPADHASVYARHLAICQRPGKTPLGRWKHCQQQRSTPEQLEEFARRCPAGNIGIVLGQVSNLIGLDIDGPEAELLLAELSGGELPETLEFSTPNGGRRLLYGLPDGVIVPKRRFDRATSHVIVLGEGSLTVMPPSRLLNGEYTWASGGRPGEIEPAVCPAWLLNAAPKEGPKGRPGVGGFSSTPSPAGLDRRLRRARDYLATIDHSIQGQNGSKLLWKAVCKLVGKFQLPGDVVLDLLRTDFNPRCEPPWSEGELVHAVDRARTHHTETPVDDDDSPPLKTEKEPLMIHTCPGRPPVHGPGTAKKHTLAEPAVLLLAPPAPPAAAAFHGLAGQLVRLIEPHSEGDPVALLVQILVAFGNCIGRTAHFIVEGDTHYLNLFAVLVGMSSKGRKGSSWGQVKKFFSALEPDWAKECVKSGLTSGEGLIWAVRDPIWKTERVKKNGNTEYEELQVDAGVQDKRLLCYEPEFASLLKVMDRQGNTLSPLLRQFWDGAEVIQTLTKNSPAKATGAHNSTIGHVTAEELRRYLSATEQANGFGNRFLWLAVQRSKKLPEGGQLAGHTLDALRAKFGKAVDFARSQGAIGFDCAGRDAWHIAYDFLSEGKPGLAGCMLARAEAQVRRLACLYALLDLSPVVRVEHLQAALALWKYFEETVRYVFGNSLGDLVADDILLALQATPEGLSREEIRKNVFQGHKSSAAIARAVALLQALNLAHCEEKKDTGGRPETRWYAGPKAA
jgi:hypothetical protein